MEEKDLKQIEAMMTRVVGRFRSETVEAFDQRIGVLEESFQHKLDLVVEGQQLLAEKLEATRTELKTDIAKVDHRLTVGEARFDQRFDGLEKKLDHVAADLQEHRADTEAHRKGWRVRED